MKRDYIRQIVVYEDHFIEFKKKLDRETLKKVYQVFLLIMSVRIIPDKFLRPITSVKGLYEIRVEDKGNAYRIFCCFDENKIVVLFNAFEKKTQKTPKGMIEKAEKLMNEYFNKKGYGK